MSQRARGSFSIMRLDTSSPVAVLNLATQPEPISILIATEDN